jgi:DNA-binding protein Alba
MTSISFAFNKFLTVIEWFLLEIVALDLNRLVLKREQIQQRYTQQPTTKRSERKMAENSGIVFIGRKPAMSYVLAIITSLSSSNAKEITLKARGQAITTAVDVAEITRSRFLKDLKVSKISIGTEEIPPREGEDRSRMVSTMEITLTKE